MKYVLVYHSSPRVGELAPIHFAAHRARWNQFRDDGSLLMIGPYADQSGALAVFRSREAAEAFVAGDPFVLNGVVERWELKEWLEGVAG